MGFFIYLSSLGSLDSLLTSLGKVGSGDDWETALLDELLAELDVSALEPDDKWDLETDLLDGVDARVYPVGRLDMISEGMLLLTDDGELKNRLTHPRHTIGKVYRVKVAGSVSESQYDILTSPLEIDGYTIKPVEVTVTDEDESGTVLKMTLFEGRNRQIRKMCEEAGLTVKRLSRVSIGNLKLDGLPVGKWRYLEREEVDYLYKATKELKNV